MKRSLSGVMMFAVIYTLMLPAVAMDGQTAAETPGIYPETQDDPLMSGYPDTQEEEGTLPVYHPHVHTEACYEEQPVFGADGSVTGTQNVLVCGRADWVVHEHDESCFRTVTRTVTENGAEQEVTETELVCTLPEIPEHIHDEACYETRRVLNCPFTGSEEQTFADTCYIETAGAHCGIPEHVHGAACYSEVITGTEQVLVCGYEDGEIIAPAVWSEPVYTEPVTDPDTGVLLTEGSWSEPVLLQEAVVHHHTDSCFEVRETSEIILTCTQEEHVHTEDCFRQPAGFSEAAEGHVHTDSCYREEKVLICREQELHRHTPACYESGPDGESALEMGWAWYGTDENGDTLLYGDPHHRICGRTELLRYQNSGNASPGLEAAGPDTAGPEDIQDPEVPLSEPGENYPEQTFTEETENVTVYAEAGEGAFPAETKMTVREVNDPETIDALKAAIEEKTDSVHAVDITFTDKNGKEIEPRIPIRVKLTSRIVAESEKAVVVHMDDDGETEVIEQLTEEKGEDEPAEDEILFEAEKFSVYAILGSVLETRVLTSDGSRFRIQVRFGEDADIPEGSELQAEEIPPESDQYLEYCQETLAFLQKEAGTDGDALYEIGFARFFDISILNNDEKIEPKAPVEIEIHYDDPIGLTEGEELQAVHFAETGTEIISASCREDEDGTEVCFSQSSFSVTGTVTTSLAVGWPADSGDYLLLVNTGNSADYYVIDHDGTLVPVSYDPVERIVSFDDNYNTVEDMSSYLWNYIRNNGNSRLYNNEDRYIYPGDGFILSSTWINLGRNNNNNYLTVGSTYNRYYLSLDLTNYRIQSRKAGYTYQGYTYPDSPANVYFVPYSTIRDNEGHSIYSGRDIDKEMLDQWDQSLESRVPPLDDLDKTATVFDYDNRIYQIDLTAASGVQTFASDLDIAFMLDFSNSMLFPATLHPTDAASVLTQYNLEALANAGRISRDTVYTIITDRNGTATNYAVYYYQNARDRALDKNSPQLTNLERRWVYFDMSHYAKTQAGIQRYSEIGSGGRYPNNLPNNGTITIDGKDGQNVAYRLYTADQGFFDGMTAESIYSENHTNGGNRLYYLKTGVIDTVGDLMSIANKDDELGLSTKILRIAYNQFWGSVGPSQNWLQVTNIAGAQSNYETIVGGLIQGRTDGDTNQGLALSDSHITWNGSSSKYAILITDGAPLDHTNPDTNALNQAIINAANALKNKGVTLITVGISLDYVLNGQYILHEKLLRTRTVSPISTKYPARKT